MIKEILLFLFSISVHNIVRMQNAPGKIILILCYWFYVIEYAHSEIFCNILAQLMVWLFLHAMKQRII
jgi:ATP/ADP translocase